MSMEQYRFFEPVRGDNGAFAVMPVRGTKYSAGYDLCSAQDVVCHPFLVTLVPTGIKVHTMKDEYLQVTLRSSFAIKNLCMMPNAPAIIDADYFENPTNDGEIFIPVYNFNTMPIYIKRGDRIAQGVFLPYECTLDDKTNEVRVGGCGSTNHTLFPS